MIEFIIGLVILVLLWTIPCLLGHFIEEEELPNVKDYYDFVDIFFDNGKWAVGGGLIFTFFGAIFLAWGIGWIILHMLF